MNAIQRVIDKARTVGKTWDATVIEVDQVLVDVCGLHRTDMVNRLVDTLLEYRALRAALEEQWQAEPIG